MFRKLLVANRGEIACRIIRAAKELGIQTVAIYNEIEGTARHVKMADEAYMIGVDPLDTYLNKQRILDLALEVGADAIHPGYGFLAENAEFARMCEQAGITFVGPPWQVIELMGDKARSKEVMKKAGVPVVPGSEGILRDAEEARELAREIGYPVLLKATAGGGGRGIRICRNEEELLKNYESAYNEAQKAFGCGDLLLEKYIENPKHIEFQVLGDNSLLLDDEKRAYYGEIVAKAAKEIGYYNAGTMEFIADEQGNLYFIEMNTRIQVEHPVTEMVTGIDYYVPGGFGIRVEHAASRGFEVTPYYDSMIAKLIVWAPSWEVAVDRMRAALETYEITGVKTTIPLLIEIMKEPDFRAGRFTTKYLEEHPQVFDYREHRHKEDYVALISAVIASYHGL